MLRTHFIARHLLAYLAGSRFRTVRVWARRCMIRLEGGEAHSATLRLVMARLENKQIGEGSTGAFFMPHRIPRHSTIGRNCWMSADARIFAADHPAAFISTHGFFFNPHLGYTASEMIERKSISVGDNVRIWPHATVLSSVRSIGSNVVVLPHAVVHRDVPDNAVVVGNPARCIFPQPANQSS